MQTATTYATAATNAATNTTAIAKANFHRAFDSLEKCEGYYTQDEVNALALAFENALLSERTTFTVPVFRASETAAKFIASHYETYPTRRKGMNQLKRDIEEVLYDVNSFNKQQQDANRECECWRHGQKFTAYMVNKVRRELAELERALEIMQGK